MIDAYDWAGGREAMVRFGPADGPVVVAAMPLLEEWNRTRAFVVALLRALAGGGIAGALPDMPGHGESLAALPDLSAMRDAMAAAVAHVDRPTVAIGVRSGALLDTRAAHRGRWHLSPQTGAEVIRDLHRIALAGGTTISEDAAMVAGTGIPATLLASLAEARLSEKARIVRLDTDPRPADRRLPGPALWRRAEPGNDPALVAALADDIAAWLPTCVG